MMIKWMKDELAAAKLPENVNKEVMAKVLDMIDHSLTEIEVGYLKDLLAMTPLTPLTEEDGWDEKVSENGNTLYTHKRMMSLNKITSGDKVDYTDRLRMACVNIRTGDIFYSDTMTAFLDAVKPIKMPYTAVPGNYTMVLDVIGEGHDPNKWEAFYIVSIANQLGIPIKDYMDGFGVRVEDGKFNKITYAEFNTLRKEEEAQNDKDGAVS